MRRPIPDGAAAAVPDRRAIAVRDTKPARAPIARNRGLVFDRQGHRHAIFGTAERRRTEPRDRELGAERRRFRRIRLWPGIDRDRAAITSAHDRVDRRIARGDGGAHGLAHAPPSTRSVRYAVTRPRSSVLTIGPPRGGAGGTTTVNDGRPAAGE